MSLPLPSLFGSHWLPSYNVGRAQKRKREGDGRETGVRMKVTPVPSALCASAFETCDGRKGGTFSNSSIFSVQDDISDLLLVRRVRTLSPQASDCQSVGTDYLQLFFLTHFIQLCNYLLSQQHPRVPFCPFKFRNGFL